MNPCDQPGVNDGGVQTASPHSLDLKATRFSLQNARELALYARQAYSEATVQDDHSDTQVLVLNLGDCIVIAFRGTSDLRDFITDGDCWRMPVQCGEVHSGFWKAWIGIKWPLNNFLNTLPALPIFVTGHSLGGALAIICGKYLVARGLDVRGIYTFGCPRVGDKTFQKNFDTFSNDALRSRNQTLNDIDALRSRNQTLNDITFTVINDVDIVPRIPGYLSGYRCPGTVEFIPEVGGIVEDPSFWFRLGSDVISLAQGWWGKRSPEFLAELLLDHHIDNYIAALREVEG